MKVSGVAIRNFRRLENVQIDLEDRESIFVGPNNSGKTSATAIFRCFLGGRDFKIHDFSVARMPDFDTFAVTGDADQLPKISLDLWFTIDPESIGFGRVFTLLPKLSDFTRVGIRLSYEVSEAKKLRENYDAAYPPMEDGTRTKSLPQYLALGGNLGRHFTVCYSSLDEKIQEGTPPEILTSHLDPDEGKRLLKHLIRVEFVDAQRNINDDDSNRSNRLSSAFSTFYQKNLEQLGHAADAHSVIDENNKQLTDHYAKQFAPLINLIKSLGVPSINDRELQIISSLSPETALRGNTELLYIDPSRKHELPELYNGLGFKNLIFMAIQARHFHSQWVMTTENRPLCLMIFIEEPEVHLHAQVQQTFISNIWQVINQSAEAAGEPNLVPQLVVTTHSSHIMEAVDFEKVRYFQRGYSEGEMGAAGIRNASVVRSLRTFQPEVEMVDGNPVSPSESLAFLKRYLRLTHCDLFFADAAILVEGAVEKLLMPSMIERAAGRLRTVYLTILEVGGAYAHRFEGLLSFLHIPYLVITDIDSVVPTGSPSACRADLAGARTSNASLKKLCGQTTIANLMALTSAEKQHTDKDRCIAFQTDVLVEDDNASAMLRPRTLEEAIVYENFGLLRSGVLSIGTTVRESLSDAYQDVYNRVRSDNFKKTDFAMDILACTEEWIVPEYIAEGLSWLESRLLPPPPVAGAIEVPSVAGE
ncbi:ATP-dependent nuclease [Pectobacterium brasiliense]|uniref:ATP-dependent nuclease n=1 Tax=Pectobacterium brasiliense TaxID=180957 RepID=UPI00193DAA82|nr:ATP-dependent endonuclease [Pectobacterium brasiliense]QRN33217.1 AAA family ATPase [Pectobacterium brasiliense]